MRHLKSAALLITSLMISAQAWASITLEEATRMAVVVHRAMAPGLEQQHKKVVYRWIEDNPYFEMRTISNNEPNSYMVIATKGLYNHPAMTQGIYLLLTCHELGHILGGAPFNTQKFSGLLTQVQLENLSQLSAEGQADYFATNVCMPIVLNDVSILIDVLEDGQNETVRDGCNQMQGSDLDRRICMASSILAAHTTRLFSTLPSVLENAPVFEPINANVGAVQTSTLDTYPTLQCRLQTFFSGALHAHVKTIYEPRPSCWFAPEAGAGPRMPTHESEVASSGTPNSSYDPFEIPEILRRGEGKTPGKP